MIYFLAKIRLKKLVDTIEHYLNPSDKIIDIGAGMCIATEILKQRKYHIIPLDIKNLSFVENIEPMLYDGVRMPFKDNYFDVALVFTVLHHITKQKKLIQESMRISKKLIIVEDIYTSKKHKYLTFFMDSLINLEFYGHPHSNQTDIYWRNLFKEMGLKLNNIIFSRMYIFFKIVYYFLEK